MDARLLVAELGALDATRIGAPLNAGLRAAARAEAALLVAPVVSQGIALGAFQRLRSTLDSVALEGSGLVLARRATGGPAIRVGRGQVLVALDLRDPSALGGVADPSRALNRHVRPILRALTELGDVAATSGGRDLVLMRGEPIAWVGVGHAQATQRTWLEAVVALETPFELPAHTDLAHGAIAPRWNGKKPTTLRAMLGRDVSPDEVVASIVHAYAAAADGRVETFVPPAWPASRVRPEERPFTAMIEEAIGLLGAVVEEERLAIGGDLMASSDALDALGRTLFVLGPDADDDAIARAIDETFAPGSGALLLGVKSLGSIARLVRAAWAATKSDARG